jgi:predicted DNA-binding protein
MALSPEGGKAKVASTRLPHADNARLGRLAAERGLTPSQLIRQFIQHGLDQLEQRDTEPP